MIKGFHKSRKGFPAVFICFVFLMVLIGSINEAKSCTIDVVVYPPGETPCISGNREYTSIQAAVNGEVSGVGGSVTVCPGTYIENVEMTNPPWDMCELVGIDPPCFYTYDIYSYSNNPADTVVIAANPNKPVFYVSSAAYIGGISGFTLKRATGWCTGYPGGDDDCAGMLINNGVAVYDNVIRDNIYGIKLYGGGSNSILNNVMVFNDHGIKLVDTVNNTIYHNDIIDNSTQAGDNNPANNDWHHTTLLEGNYWTDYTGVDDGSGTGKHAIAGDGIGDTLIPWPYVNYDNYPYMFSKAWLCSDLPVRIEGTSLEFYSLQEAYDRSLDGETIQSRAINFPEDPDFDLNKSVYLKAGYDCDFIDNPDETVIYGTMIISEGKITIESGTVVLI